MPHEIVCDIAAIGFSSNSSDPVCRSFILSTPNRVASSVLGMLLTYNRDICLLCDMVFQHLIVVQLVYTVAGSNDHVWLMAFLQEIQVLIDGICRTAVPEAVVRGNRRCEIRTVRPAFFRNPTIWKSSDAHSGTVELYCVSTATF